MGQRERSRVFAVVVAATLAMSARAADPAAEDPAAADPAAPAPAAARPATSNDGGAAVQQTEPGDAPEQEPERERPLPFAVGIGAGYGFRPHPDGRSHGGTAHLYGDLPIGLGFGVRPEVLGFTYGSSADVDGPLAHPMAAASLTYAFDDTDAIAVVGVGGFVGVPIDLARDDDAAIASPLGVPLSGGVLLSLGLRFPVIPGVRVEAAIRVPFALVEPPPPAGQDPNDDLHTQVSLTGALVLTPEVLAGF